MLVTSLALWVLQSNPLSVLCFLDLEPLNHQKLALIVNLTVRLRLYGLIFRLLYQYSRGTKKERGFTEYSEPELQKESFFLQVGD
jgi:hypothetical protein